MYYYPNMGKVLVQMPTNRGYLLPRNIQGNNELNVPWISIYLGVHQLPVRRVPAQDGFFSLILWYVSKYLFRS